MWVRNNNAKEDFKAYNSFPILTTHLNALEKHAAMAFTQTVFKRVVSQIGKVIALNLTPPIAYPGCLLYEMSKYGDEAQRWTVTHYKGDDQSLKCSCKLYESKGIPCCHLFAVIRCESMKKISKCLILKRFKKEARVGIVFPVHDDVYDPNVVLDARFGGLSASCKNCVIWDLGLQKVILLQGVRLHNLLQKLKVCGSIKMILM